MYPWPFQRKALQKEGGESGSRSDALPRRGAGLGPRFRRFIGAMTSIERAIYGRRFKTSWPVGGLVIMPVKLLLREKNELRLRIIGESHTALQMLRERLNNHKNVEYANYFPGHPELDDPEFYIRTKGKSASDKVLRELVAGLADEFEKVTL